ncbi:radical SAM protein [Propionivibrio sp.]|uniref:radical SAM protein n=1 Tax=Propionivibrio sp. TaxID=2212460 RepID=UPI003BF2D1DA
MENRDFPSQQELAIALSPRSLTLMILPTEQCNFRCVYCYEDFSAGKMKPELVEGIKQLIDRRIDGLTYIALSWFGGEPLVAKDIVFDISEHVDRRCREHGVVHTRGVMTTNGYLLTPSVMERLTKANQSYFQISLDGLGETHDATRPLMSGKGTFDTLWKNLQGLRQSTYDFQIELRLHFGGCDPAESEALCREINGSFGGDPRFSVYLKCIEDYGGPNGGRIKPLPRDIAEKTSEHLATLLPDIVTSHMYQEKMLEICYAAHPNNLLIRADGRVGKCALALKDPRNTIGHLDEEGRLHIDNQRFQPWMEGFKELDEELLACPYHGINKTPHLQEIIFS